MPKLSVLIPHYNEKATLLELIQKVMAVPIEKEIILVDDASTDGSKEIIQREMEGCYHNLRVVYHSVNQGKGAAIRTALSQAKGDIVIVQDADLEYNPEDYIKICQAFSDETTHVVYGTRFKYIDNKRFLWHWFSNRFLGAHYEIRYLHHFLGIQFLNFLSNVLYGTHLTDEATCYKAFRKDIFNHIHLRCRGFEFCPEVTAKVCKAGYAIVEVPISYHPRSHRQGKKLSFWRHGFQAIFTLVKYRFVN